MHALFVLPKFREQPYMQNLLEADGVSTMAITIDGDQPDRYTVTP